MDTKDNPRRRLEAKSVAEQAAEWLMILEDRGAEANPAFSDWLRESPTHVQAYLRAATLDTMMRRIDPEHALETPRPEPGSVIPDIGPDLDESLFERSAAPARNRMSWRLAASLAAVGVLAAGSWLAVQRTHDPQQLYRTEIGEQRTLELPDGSTLMLNTDSRVKVRFTGHERQLYLLAGEAIFRVQRDPSRPFRVHSGDAIVQAIGTEFNVYRKADQTTVSVLEGRVAVMPANADKAPEVNVTSAANGNGSANAQGVLLNAGEELRVGEHGPAPKKLKANIAKVTAWRQRRLVFVDEPLSTIGYELNRYNRTPKIRVEGAAAQRRYAVILDADDPQSLAAVLAGDSKVVIERKNDEWIVRER